MAAHSSILAFLLLQLGHIWGFPGGSDGKESACNVRDLGSIPGLRRSPGERNGYPLHYSCLENFTDRGAWKATVHVVAKCQTQLRQLRTHACIGKLRFRKMM